MPDKDGIQLWRPEILRTGDVIDNDTLSTHISDTTTLTKADIAAAFYSLPRIMDLFLRRGDTVRLNGIGTFTAYGRSKGKGVADNKDVRPTQFSSIVLKFRPEYKRSVGGKVTRTLLNEVEFTHINSLLKGRANINDNDNSGGGNGDDDGGWVDPSA